MFVTKVKGIFLEINLVKYFSRVLSPRTVSSSNLGRWNLKSSEQIEYYMTRMHADPGYQLNNSWKYLQRISIEKK